MTIKMLEYPSSMHERGGEEIASIIAMGEGDRQNLAACVNTKALDDPGQWAMALGDLVRQLAISYNLNKLSLNGRLLSIEEIQETIVGAFLDEIENPTTDITQVEDTHH